MSPAIERPKLRIAQTLLLGTVLLLVASFRLIAQAQDSGTKISPQAREQLGKVAQSYQALSAYVDSGHVSTQIVVEGKTQNTEADTPIRLERPNRISVTVDGVTLTSNGKTLRTDLASLKTFRTEAAPTRLNLDALEGGPLGAVLLGGPSEHPVRMVLSMLLMNNALDRLMEGVTAANLEPTAKFEGVEQALTAITLERGVRPGFRIGIDPETSLLKAIDLAPDATRLAANGPPRTQVSGWTLRWRSGAISTAVPEAGNFATPPPAGYTEIVKAVAANPSKKENVSPLVGKPSPEFKLDIMTEKGSRSVSNKDLIGKVVVLDFWATWCGPCKAELPEIQTLVNRLAKQEPAKVQVIAVSQDRAPEDGTSLRSLAEKTLKDLELNLVGGPVSQVALDPDQVVGDVFSVTGLPTIVVLNQKGIVQAVHVGYQQGIGELLFNDVQALLSGKTLVEGEAKPATTQPR